MHKQHSCHSRDVKAYAIKYHSLSSNIINIYQEIANTRKGFTNLIQYNMKTINQSDFDFKRQKSDCTKES